MDRLRQTDWQMNRLWQTDWQMDRHKRQPQDGRLAHRHLRNETEEQVEAKCRQNDGHKME